jgi:hypothetical protein
MSAITAANVATCLDKLCRGYSSLVGTSASDMGIGESGATYGAYDALDDIRDLVVAAADNDQIGDMLTNMNANLVKFTASKIAGTYIGSTVKTISSHVSRRSGIAAITGLEAFLTYYNCTDATKWQCLAPTQWYDLYYAIYGVRPAINNVYFEVLQGSTYANGLRKLVVATTTQTAGATVDSAKYCGGFPQIKVSGITGSGVVTVTGTEYNPATKTTTAGVTWTVTASADTTYALAVGTAAADSLIVAVSNIAVAAGITAGTIYVEAARPSGRALVS